MDRATTIKNLEATLLEWEAARTWGAIEIEVHDGAVVLIRKETKEKFTAPGGHQYVPGRENR